MEVPDQAPRCHFLRRVAQPGRALLSHDGCQGFEPLHGDQFTRQTFSCPRRFCGVGSACLITVPIARHRRTASRLRPLLTRFKLSLDCLPLSLGHLMRLTVDAAAKIAVELEKPDPRFGTQRTLCGGFRAPDGAAFSALDVSVPALVGTPSGALNANFWLVPDATADDFADRLADAWETLGGHPALVGIWCSEQSSASAHGHHLIGCVAAGSAPRLCKNPPAGLAEVLSASLGQVLLVDDAEDQWAFSLLVPLCRALFTAHADTALIEAQWLTVLSASADNELEDVLVALNDHLQEADDAHRDWIDGFIAQQRHALKVA